MTTLNLIAIILLTIAIVFCIRRLVFAILNLIALKRYDGEADPINQRHGMVFNKKTSKLEADQSPILPFE